MPTVLKCFFQTKSLAIRAPLAGSIHRFKLHNRIPIEVHLPKAPPKKSIGDHNMNEHTDIYCYAWRAKTKVPVEFGIRRVRVMVDLKRTLTVPEACLNHVDPLRHSKSARHELDKVVEDAERIAEEAFRVWVRTLRWKTRYASINQMLIEPLDVSHGAYLTHADTLKAFYSPIGIITVGPREPIARRMWNSCGKSLRDGKTPPLWLDFLFEGEHRVRSADLHGGVVCLAIACELLIRRLIMRPTNRRFLGMLKKREISVLLDHWQNIGPTGGKLNAAMNHGRLKRLFTLRNGIMHDGQIGILKDVECRELAKMARTFIMVGTKLGERIPPP